MIAIVTGETTPPPEASRIPGGDWVPHIRSLADDTLVVVLSDSHIGGDPGRDIFEAVDELTSLFAELADRAKPVELVLGGDFFDFLEIRHLPSGTDRAAVTIARPEYRDMFGALRRFAAASNHHVVYMPGNHDTDMWWDPEIRQTLRDEKLVDEFVLS